MRVRALLTSLSFEDALKALTLVALAVYPLSSPGAYNLDLVSTSVILGVFALSVDLLWGYTGILNLGPAASFALGGYVWAIGTKRIDFFESTYLVLLIAVALPAALALAVSYVSFRAGAREIYFALITLAVALTLQQGAQVWYDFTGGSNGIIDIDFPDVGIPGVVSYPIDQPERFFYFTLVLTAIVLLFCTLLVRSPFGRILRAIRGSEVRAETLGFSTLRYKVIISTVSAAIGGLAGAVYAPVVGIVHPDLFGVVISIQVFVWIAIGGQGTLIGPLLGALAISLVEARLSASFVSYYLIVVGGIFVGMVLLVPDGLLGLIKRLGRLALVLPARRGAPASRSEP